MFLQAERVPQASHIEADICVIGAGAAGIAFTREFLGTGVRVCLLESGELMTRPRQTATDAYRWLRSHFSPAMGRGTMDGVTHKVADRLVHDPLYELEYTDLPLSLRTRRRAFGGSTISWSGRWKRHDRIDFEMRPWVPNSGWPFSRNKLDPYYARASASLRAPDAGDDAVHEDLLQAGALETVAFLVQKKRLWNWGITFRQDFQRSLNIMVCLGAHVVSIAGDGCRIGTACVKTCAGRTFEVHASFFILACGGIENARLLLLSHLGNEHDQVGRYYMNHPKGRAGIVHLTAAFPPPRTCRTSNGQPALAGLRLSDEVQEREQILNSQIFLEPTDGRTALERMTMKVRQVPAANALIVVNCMEQLPVSTNRVTLARAKDPMGLPRASVSWSLSDLDKRTMVIFHRYLKEALLESGIGTLQSPLPGTDPADFPIAGDAFHHMGTTRMGHDPRTSVVDEDCRLHSVDNLFVAGSSVFPTSGHANPTATLCALSIRLADHIKRMLSPTEEGEAVSLRTVP